MNLGQTIRLLLRNWFVFVPVLILALGSAAWAYASTPPQFEVHESVLFLPPALPATATVPGTNPYLTFGTSISITAHVFSQLLTSDDVKNRLARRGASGLYTALPSVDGTPVLQLTATDPSADLARRTLAGLEAFIIDDLEARQRASGAPVTTWIRATVVTDPQPPQRSRADGLRTGAAVGTAGLLLALTAPFAVEVLAARRRTRTRAVAGQGSWPSHPPSTSELRPLDVVVGRAEFRAPAGGGRSS